MDKHNHKQNFLNYFSVIGTNEYGNITRNTHEELDPCLQCKYESYLYNQSCLSCSDEIIPIDCFYTDSVTY